MNMIYSMVANFVDFALNHLLIFLGFLFVACWWSFSHKTGNYS